MCTDSPHVKQLCECVSLLSSSSLPIEAHTVCILYRDLHWSDVNQTWLPILEFTIVKIHVQKERVTNST